MATEVVVHASTSVFELGSLSVEVILKQWKPWDSCSPPTSLLILSPKVKGQYPVLIFNNGFAIINLDYTQLLTHVASHGFIVVAPQLGTILPHFNYSEMNCLADVTNWLSDGLPPLLPPNVEANLHKLALSGHSRGGRTAFSLITHKPNNLSLNFSALIGVDPVMGFPIIGQIIPDVLTYKPNSLNLGMPVMVVGTGLGSEPVDHLIPHPCAPPGLNHEEVFRECQAPCYHFVTKDYGHMDVIDDNPQDPIGVIASCICKKGEGSKDLMRRCVGGLIVAFLEAHLEGKNGDLFAIIDNPKIAPVVLNPVQCREYN